MVALLSCSRALVVCVVRYAFALVEVFTSWYNSTRWVGMGSMKGGLLLVVEFEWVCLASRRWVSPIWGRFKIRAL